MQPRLAIESTIAFQELEKGLKQDGDLVEFAALEAAIGMDPTRGKGYAYVSTARRRYETAHDCVTEPERGRGIRRLTGHGTINRSARQTRKMNKLAKHMSRDLTTVTAPERYNQLNPEDRQRLNGRLSLAGVLAHFTRTDNVQRIEKATEPHDRALPIGDLAALFAKREKK